MNIKLFLSKHHKTTTCYTPKPKMWYPKQRPRKNGKQIKVPDMRKERSGSGDTMAISFSLDQSSRTVIGNCMATMILLPGMKVNKRFVKEIHSGISHLGQDVFLLLLPVQTADTCSD